MPTKKSSPTFRIRIEFEESENLSTADITEFLSLFEAATTLAVKSKAFTKKGLPSPNDIDSATLDCIVWEAMSMKGGNAFEKYYKNSKKNSAIALKGISFQSPLLVDYETGALAIALWTVFDKTLPYIGAFILAKYFPEKDVEVAPYKGVEIKLKASRVSKSSKELRRRLRIPNDMRPAPRLGDRLIELSDDGVKALLAQSTEGQGGFQTLIKRLQSNVNEKTNTIRISHQDRIRIYNYATKYRQGGWQDTLKEVFGAHFNNLIK